VVACALLFAACLTHADAAFAQNSGAAQSLFEEGVRLMKEKKYAEACPKLAESHKLEPGGGTDFNLAICPEGEGKPATAYVADDESTDVRWWPVDDLPPMSDSMLQRVAAALSGEREARFTS